MRRRADQENSMPRIESKNRVTNRCKIPKLHLLTAVLLLFIPFMTCTSAAADSSAITPPRILHIMSYHRSWEWNADQLRGFKQGLNLPGADFKVFEMDTKRNSSEHWKQSAGKQAMALIDGWKPDLVYTNDDNAQAYVAKYYVNHTIPFVFSGVNAAPEEYGFTGSTNITGVLEQEHFVATINLLRDLVPNTKKIAVILDEGPTWPAVVKRMQDRLPKLPGVEIFTAKKVKTFSGYKSLIKDLQDKVDALALLGIFTFKDGSGSNVPFTEVLKWTAQNSNLPDFSYWDSRVPYGTLCAVAVSGYAQGLEAGKIARGILVDGRAPSTYPIEPTVKGKPVVSLARARDLGITVSTNILLTAQVIPDYQWNNIDASDHKH